jgi:actin-related protein
MFHSSADQDILREMKENKCVVSTEPKEDEAAVATDEYQPSSYKLPDGSLLELGAERFRAPEILFKPSLIGSEEPGLAELLREGVGNANRDLRRELYREIVLCGGSTLFEGVWQASKQCSVSRSFVSSV